MAKRVRRQIEPTAEDLSNVEFETSEEVDVAPTFDSMGLNEKLLRGIYAYGLSTNLISYVKCTVLFI